MKISTKLSIYIFALTISTKKSYTLDIHATPQEFCYNSDGACGPETWEKFSANCKGKNQSPVNLHVPSSSKSPQSHKNIIKPHEISIPLSHFKCDHFFMQNNGHTLNLDFATYERGGHIFPGYGLTNVQYRFANAHFHWGKNDGIGSEHQINGRSYSMEMHLVHYKEKYNTMKEAIQSQESDALAVVAIFLQASPKVRKPSPALEPIIKNLNYVHQKHWFWVKVEEPLDLTPLIPKYNHMKVYSYKGSLTTPSCNEQVTWYVFETPVLIASSDVSAFRHLKDGRGHSILENHRPVQKNYGRQVETLELRI